MFESCHGAFTLGNNRKRNEHEPKKPKKWLGWEMTWKTVHKTRSEKNNCSVV